MVARILIVEDDPGLRQVMQVQLTKEGYEVTLAANAEEAIELLQKSHQDLIITDLHMPGISGIDLLKKVRAEDPGGLATSGS